MGKTAIAVCLADRPLRVDGNTTDVAEDKPLVLPAGVQISRSGNVYLITDASGDSVRAELDGSYINVSVGLGHWPAQAHGVLAKANGHVNQIAARDGPVLTAPAKGL